MNPLLRPFRGECSAPRQEARLRGAGAASHCPKAPPSAPVLFLRRGPLLRDLPSCRRRLSDSDAVGARRLRERGISLRRRSNRSEEVLENLLKLILDVRAQSDFDYYARLIPGLVSS